MSGEDCEQVGEYFDHVRRVRIRVFAPSPFSSSHRVGLPEGSVPLPKPNYNPNEIGRPTEKSWNYGYKVTTKYRSVEFSSIIKAVTISVDANGEKIQAKAEYES